MTKPRRFSGESYDEQRDHDRLAKNYDYVFAMMRRRASQVAGHPSSARFIVSWS
jgi:hypothetical protein